MKMELYKILDIYNKVTENTLVVVRNKESASSFYRNQMLYKISLIDVIKNIEVFYSELYSKAASTEDKYTLLEYDVIEYLFKELKKMKYDSI